VKLLSLVLVCLLATSSMAYQPQKFNSSDNISLSDIAPKLADGVGVGLSDTKDNAGNLIDDFMMFMFFVAILAVIVTFKKVFKTWGK
jgi:hypothetical protein